MARRLITKITNSATNRVAKVYRDTEWNEYVVEFYIAGTKQAGASYHTDDLQDAEGTAGLHANFNAQQQGE